MNRWHVMRSGPTAAAVNMAIDEALLRWQPRLRTPILRFYSWSEPAATFGYFQRYTEVEATTPLRPLVRRPTGGGLVPHAADWTYAVSIPNGHEWYGLAATESYRRIHEWIRMALATERIDAELAPCCSKAGLGQCFVGYEQYDLLWSGRKIAGAAQRRTREGLLIQGSVQPAVDGWRRDAWEQAMCDVAEHAEGAQWRDYAPEAGFWAMAEQFAREKYGGAEYNRKR